MALEKLKPQTIRSVDAVTHLFRGRTFSALSHGKWMNGILELGCGKRQISSRCERCAALQAILYVDRMTTCCFFAFAQRTKIRDNWRQSSRVPIMLRTKKVVNTDAKRAASRKRAKAGASSVARLTVGKEHVASNIHTLKVLS